MRLNIISWNIRHLRWEKVDKYISDILRQVDAGHIMFFYENKQSNGMGREFVDAIGNGLGGSTATGSTRLEWGGYSYSVGTNENVWVIYSKKCKTGPKSKHGPGQEFSLTLFPQHKHDSDLYSKGMAELKASSNVTILSALSVGQGDFRIPAVCNFTITKPDKTTKTIRLASWHAPGPATGAAPLLNYVFQQLLKSEVDLFIGDFNMTGLSEYGNTVNLPLTLHRTHTSTTITEKGPVAHNEGFDLVYRNCTTLFAAGQAATATMIGRASVGVVPVPDNNFVKAFELSDHRPIIVTLKEL